MRSSLLYGYYKSSQSSHVLHFRDFDLCILCIPARFRNFCRMHDIRDRICLLCLLCA